MTAIETWNIIALTAGWITCGGCFMYIVTGSDKDAIPWGIILGYSVPIAYVIWAIFRFLIRVRPLNIIMKTNTKNIIECVNWEKEDDIIYIKGLFRYKARLVSWASTEALIKEENNGYGYWNEKSFTNLNCIIKNLSKLKRDKDNKFKLREELLDKYHGEEIGMYQNALN